MVVHCVEILGVRVATPNEVTTVEFPLPLPVSWPDRCEAQPLFPKTNARAGSASAARFGGGYFFSSGFFAPVSSRILPSGDNLTSTSFLSAVTRTTS